MRPLIHGILRKTLHHLPQCVLNELVGMRRTLANHLPKGAAIRWRYYLGDVSVLIEVGNPIEWPMLIGEYEEDVSRVIADFAKPGSHCIDVGANVGPITLLLAKQVGAAGRVAAVEPGPPYRDRLEANLTLNPRLRDRVVVIAAGLSNRDGTLNWQADPNAPFNACMHDVKPWGRTGSIVPVPVTTLDALAASLTWPKVDFIKIDVEGMEWEVLLGGRDLLARHRPIVLFEALECFRAYRRAVSGFDVFAEITSFLADLDYLTYLPPPTQKKLVDRSSDRLPNVAAIPAGTPVPAGYRAIRLTSPATASR
jgi:FkbM family methyltransferase